jgi:hypothetical protein
VRKHRRLTEQEWERTRAPYENSESRISLAQIAEIYGVAVRTVEGKSAKQGWKRASSLVTQARNEVNRVTAAAIKEGAQVAVKDAVRMMMEELQPFLAREKVEQVFRSVARAKAHQARIDRITDGYTALDKDGNAVEVPLSAKDIGYVAAAEDKFDAVIRRNLGMSDGTSIGGALNVSILLPRAAACS